jgi:hypothetical protein
MEPKVVIPKPTPQIIAIIIYIQNNIECIANKDMPPCDHFLTYLHT